MTLNRFGELAWKVSAIVRLPIGIPLLVFAVIAGYLAVFICEGELDPPPWGDSPR